MPLPQSRPFPTWVDIGATENRGLDLLGLRLPVQVLGGALFDGVTTITPSIRYLSFRAWIIHLYIQRRLPDNWKDFKRFASRIEAAVAYGTLLQGAAVPGVLGSDKATELLAKGVDVLPLTDLVEQPGISIYAAPSDQLGISFTGDSEVPGLTTERGIPLAQLIAQQMEGCALGRAFTRDEERESASRTELQEFGILISPTGVSEAERELLASLLLPVSPLPREFPRLRFYTALLWLAARLRRPVTESDLFDFATLPEIQAPPSLRATRDGWLRYGVRDAIAVAHEAVLSQIVDTVSTLQAQSEATIPGAEAIGALVAQEEDHQEALHSLALLRAEESPLQMGFRQMCDRIRESASHGSYEEGGLRRWSGVLSEVNLMKTALNTGPGALAILPVAWALAVHRVEPGLLQNGEDFQALSREGWARIGLRQVVQSGVRRFLQEDWAFRDVMVDLGFRTVDQHLRVAWGRMAQDAKHDVALLMSDAGRWRARGKKFIPRRTASRVKEAISWLTQLHLIGEQGPTSVGYRILERSLATLSELE
jgi:hypothetical protein